ncbi:MBL fold metallo-hydrolase [Candidatus Woesearchaeota archaeon]|nr:MBL fold metallo-hydrolase [Candidatus Woesearchaeota archaeon]
MEVCAVGGFGEVGKNMSAVKIGEDVIIFDMGLHLPNYIKLTEEEEAELLLLKRKDLIKAQAVPNDEVISDWKNNVRAIIPSHAHLDHIGAIPYLASIYDAPIICTPFTAAVLKAILKDQKASIPNKIICVPINSSYKINKNLKVEFVNMTHSTPETAMVALHTPEGIVIYGTDFKLDNTPTLGKKPNYSALEKLSKKGIKLAIIDSLYSHAAMKTPSECVAKEMLSDVLLGVDNKGKAIIVTTFSSHIARLKSIIEFGKKLNRKIVFLGRSLAKYCFAAEDTQISFFSKEVEIVQYSSKVAKKLKQIMKEGKEKYLLVVTGHQGEPKAILSKIAKGELPFKFDPEDNIIFSCNVIPTLINQQHRKLLEEQLHSFHVRIFKGVHVSGHGSREDIHELIHVLKPKHLIPAHSEKHVIDKFQEIACDLKYEQGKNTHTLLNGLRVRIE